jgi:hypothetical protein
LLADSVLAGTTDEGDGGFVFITPEINGWTAVIGPWFDPADYVRHEEVRALVEQLSAAYGRAHAFYSGSQNDGSAWLVAENGRIVRPYSDLSPALVVGEPLPIEREHVGRLRHQREA